MAREEAKNPTATSGEERKDDEMPRMPRLPIPGVGMPVAMPAGLPGRALWWGGLAALAALDIVEWPVAVLVGAGSWVAERYARAAAENQRAGQWKEATNMPSPTYTDSARDPHTGG